jgi:repressor LexA
MDSGLTEKQGEFLEYLRREIDRSGKPPSLRRAAQALGVSHPAVAQLLRALEEKGYVRREGRYSRTLYLLTPSREKAAPHRWREIPIVGRVTAGLPMYAQQEWDGSLVLDGGIYRGANLFALRVKGDSMRNAGILDRDFAVCEPRQYARNGEIVVVLIQEEEATIKRFFLHPEEIELRPENPDFSAMRYGFGEVLIQGKVIGILRGPEAMEKP